LEYILLLIVQRFLAVLPRNRALWLGEKVGSLLYYMGIYRIIVKKNMEHVALWDDRAEMKRIMLSLYRNMGKYAVEFLRPAYPVPPCEIHGFDEIEPLLNSGKGAIVILGHLGNWEMLSTVFGKRTGKLHVIAKPMNNSIVEKWLLAKRNASSVTTIYTSQALRKMMEVIRKDGIIAILIDQFALNHGTPAPFLGKEAKTVRTVAGLARKTGCSVISTTSIFRPDNGYDINISVVPAPDTSGLSEDEAIALMQKQHNDVLSKQITSYPDHWFGWFHRRFRGYVDYSRSR